jgi:hypothetical protein
MAVLLRRLSADGDERSVGLTVKDFKWILHEIVFARPREAGDPPLLGTGGDSLDDF